MSQQYWTLERARQVAAYLIELREAGVESRAAINSLSQGIPQDARMIQEHPETWQWLEARHWITFVVTNSPNQKWITITSVESATVK